LSVTINFATVGAMLVVDPDRATQIGATAWLTAAQMGHTNG